MSCYRARLVPKLRYIVVGQTVLYGRNTAKESNSYNNWKQLHCTYEPSIGQLKLLKIRDMFKVRLLKLYYKLCHNLLPYYFNRYQEIIELEPVRSLRQHFIHPPLIKTAYAECTPLYQLIKLVN